MVVNNYIGTDPVGDNLGGGTGIVISGSASGNSIGGINALAGNSIGGTNSPTGNTIGFNSIGVSISSSVGGNVVAGNYIGTNTAANNLHNATGILLDGDPGDSIGGTTLGSANIIGFSTGAGVSITAFDRRRGLGQLHRHRPVQRQDGERHRDRGRQFGR